MKIRSKHPFGKQLTVLALPVFLLGGCARLSTTTYVKAPWPTASFTNDGELTNTLHRLDPSGLKTNRMVTLVKNDPALEALKSEFMTDSPNSTNLDEARLSYVLNRITSTIVEEKLDAGRTFEADYWAVVTDRIYCAHNDLFDSSPKYKLKEAQEGFKSLLGGGNKISISSKTPGALALSARPFPAEQEPGGVFSLLKERAQAAVFDYAQGFGDPDEKKKLPPDKAVQKLLSALAERTEPTIPATQRVELTVCSVANSASVDDRLDYITAYFNLPAMPGQVNGSVCLERVFLLRLQSILRGRTPEERKQRLQPPEDPQLKADILRALDELRVRFEVVDKLKTDPATIKLGKLTSEAEVDVTAGKDKGPASGTGKLSATREDQISQQLDRQSAWIDETRTLLRITQRGAQEANISGSFATAVTIKIPKISLSVLKVSEQPEEKRFEGNVVEFGVASATNPVITVTVQKKAESGKEEESPKPGGEARTNEATMATAAVQIPEKAKSGKSESLTYRCASACNFMTTNDPDGLTLSYTNGMAESDCKALVKKLNSQLTNRLVTVICTEDEDSGYIRPRVVAQKGLEPSERQRVKAEFNDAEQPLYSVVDALGVVLGTVRAAEPSTYPFAKEPNGVAYTVIARPVRLNLWTNPRRLFSLTVSDVNTSSSHTKEGFRRLGVYSSAPSLRQIARLDDEKDYGILMRAFNNKQLPLVWQHDTQGPGGYWLVWLSPLVAPRRNVAARAREDGPVEPGPGEIWFGVEGTNEYDGVVVPFDRAFAVPSALPDYVTPERP